MISLVLVSHSAALARAAVGFVADLAPDGAAPVVETAAGLGEEVLGTDAQAVADAITRADAAADGDGVLVLVDLGSAVLSAQMALELLPADVAGRAVISSAPVVEGLVAAYVGAGAGMDLPTCAHSAASVLDGKRTALGEETEHDHGAEHLEPAGEQTGWSSVEVLVVNEHGLHARPAARFVACAARVAPDTRVRVSDVSSGRGPVDALSLSAVATIDAQRGHLLRIEALGPQAEQVLEELRQLAREGFGDLQEPDDILVDEDVQLPAVSTEPGVAGTGLDAALGPVIRVRLAPDAGDGEAAQEPAHEHTRFHHAIKQAVARLHELADLTRRHLGEGEAEVFDAHATLLRDPALRTDVERRIAGGASAPAAWKATIGDLVERFEQLPDDYQRERAEDVRSAGDRVLRILLGLAEPEVLGEGVLVVDELDPALAVGLHAGSVRGVITLRDAATSHGVLIAASRGVPVLTGAGARADVAAGTVVGFDVRSGRLEIDPDARAVAELERIVDGRRHQRERALRHTREPAVTTDGRHIPVAANVSSVSIARLGAELGAEGSGLVRTEALFARWRTAPTVEQQVQTYGAIATAFTPHPVTIRTWDVGGDKPLPFVPTETEANPNLGLRGLRAFVDDDDVLLTQLEAICRVALEHPVRVLFPMVTTRGCVEWAREVLHKAAARLGLDTPPPGLGVGIMIEVPSAALRVDRLMDDLDFVSIGSNDLAQYVLAAERGNPHVRRWADPLDPAVLQLIRTVKDGVPEGVPVSLCGGMAADPRVAGLLVGLGVDQLSTTASAVPMVKAMLRTGSTAAFRVLADAALECADAQEVRALLPVG